MPRDTADIGDNSDIEIGYDDLQAILDRLADKKDAVSEATGRLRSEIKEVIETRGFHKGALAVIRKIEDMSETARADFLRTFDPLFEVMYLGKWKEESANLLDQMDGEE